MTFHTNTIKSINFPIPYNDAEDSGTKANPNTPCPQLETVSEQPAQFARLKEEMANDRVVIIVGTGVSVAACGNQDVGGYKVATWTGLLAHGANHLRTLHAATDQY